MLTFSEENRRADFDWSRKYVQEPPKGGFQNGVLTHAR